MTSKHRIAGRKNFEALSLSLSHRKNLIHENEWFAVRQAKVSRVAHPGGGLIAEYDRLGAVHEHAILDVIANASGEGEPLAIASKANEILRVVVVFDPGDLLLDDRSGIQFSVA